MLNSIKRPIKARQIGLVTTYHLISGTAATPADSGLDSLFVESVQDLGVGSYKINFKASSRKDIHVQVSSVTAGMIISHAAADKSSVTIAVRDAGGLAADADFSMTCIHSPSIDAKF